MTERDAQNVQAVRRLIAAGSLSAAVRMCDESLRSTPAGPAACIFQALLLTAAERLNEAVAQYEEALAMAPNALAAYMGIADILSSKGWIASAAIVMEIAGKAAPFTAEAQEQCDALRARLMQAKWVATGNPT